MSRWILGEIMEAAYTIMAAGIYLFWRIRKVSHTTVRYRPLTLLRNYCAMLSRKRGRRVPRAWGVPRPYFRTSSYMIMRELHCLVTHENLGIFWGPTFPGSGTGLMPAYCFAQQVTVMNARVVMDPSDRMTTGDMRSNFGSWGLMSLSYYPYVSLMALAGMPASRGSMAPGSTIPPPLEDWSSVANSMLLQYTHVQCVGTTWSWNTEYPTDQFKLEYGEGPEETMFTLEPRHRRPQVAWFRETGRMPDPLSRSGLISTIAWDGAVPVGAMPTSGAISPWSEFHRLIRDQAYKFGGRGRIHVPPWVGTRRISSYCLEGPTVAGSGSGTAGRLEEEVIDPGPFRHPGVPVASLRRGPVSEASTQEIRHILGGGFLYFFIPGINAVTQTNVQPADPGQVSVPTVHVVRAVPPAMIWLTRTTKFRFFGRLPLQQEAIPFVSPIAAPTGSARVVSLRTARLGHAVNLSMPGPPMVGRGAGPYPAVSDVVVFTDVDGHAPMG